MKEVASMFSVGFPELERDAVITGHDWTWLNGFPWESFKYSVIGAASPTMYTLRTPVSVLWVASAQPGSTGTIQGPTERDTPAPFGYRKPAFCPLMRIEKANEDPITVGVIAQVYVPRSDPDPAVHATPVGWLF
jgi:hypothetical protein